MLEVNLHNIKGFLGLGLVKIALVYPITKESHFMLLNGLKITLSDGRIIVIPDGFVFNGSSSPRGIWWLFPSYGDFSFAALLHDWLYEEKYLSEDIGMNLAQRYADDEMLIWSNVINDKNSWKLLDNKMRYKAVRWFGKKEYLD